jgi:SAM-dependent methyltransferase/Zn ribbon nucleic-acid-binding protein
MNQTSQKEFINCLYCDESKYLPWATENGFSAVKCSNCGLVYVNPRPILSLVSEAVRTGVHSDVEHGRTAIGKRMPSKVKHYKKILSRMFEDIWANSKTISWLDVGAGYGEVIEAISQMAPAGSKIVGLEPMKPKAIHARARNLTIKECYLNEIDEKFDFLSLINVYSHIPDFRTFLQDIKKVLTAKGEVFIETGNTADLKSRYEVPGELDLPDHLVFAGEKHLIGYLQESGFSIVSIERSRVDGLLKLVKNLIKRLIGRTDVSIKIPYTSSYRSLMIRARLNSIKTDLVD